MSDSICVSIYILYVFNYVEIVYVINKEYLENYNKISIILFKFILNNYFNYTILSLEIIVTFNSSLVLFASFNYKYNFFFNILIY